jgi:transcription termination factor Rho
LSETDLVSTEAAPRKRGGLTGMVRAELRQLAGELKIPDTTGMRKGDLIAAIKERQAGGPAPAKQLPLPPIGAAEPPVTPVSSTDAAPVANATAPAPRRRRAATRPAGAPDPQPAVNGAATNGAAPDAPAVEAHVTEVLSPVADVEAPVAGAPITESPATAEDAPPVSRRSRQRRGRGEQNGGEQGGEAPAQEQAAPAAGENDVDRPQRGEGRRNRGEARDLPGRADGNRNDSNGSGRSGGDNRGGGDNRPDTRNDNRNDNRADNRADNRNDSRGPRDNRPDDDGDDDGDGRGRRGRRFRDRRRGRDRNDRQGGGQGGGQGNVDTEVRDGDVLLPVAGIIDVLDNYAFVRTTGYLSGPTDVYVSLSVVRKYGLRRGDAITGAVREPREGEQSRQKFNPLVRVDSINGQDPEASRDRPEFTKLTPLYPNERLRLETEPSKLTTRVIDLVMPIGKGQRALIVSPPKAGKTMIMQSIANAITTNNPECHLMVVLVDERPEEVTDMQRSVKGEVIASTFDRPPGDHTTVAELAIERAKRLVEMGHDVVVLLDSITRLGRAYNLAAPASGRILSGGVDSTALYPPKRFLGAARNIEDGGSLTIFATALVETGSTMDTVIFEEFKGTGNAELKLDRKIADKRVFPAIDIDASGTRKEELLLSPDELAVTVKLRRVLSALDDQQALDLVLTQLRKTRTNIEFLMQVAKNTPGALNNDD